MSNTANHKTEIEKRQGMEATFVKTNTMSDDVVKKFTQGKAQNKLAAEFDGTVDTFYIEGRKGSKIIYAWTHTEKPEQGDSTTQIHTILDSVTTPTPTEAFLSSI